ncbi:hypothetical protein [Halorhabdus rudnickae]|uniref:hypothetical protein n=1 Tax=Halorhabdus rudnickae TaxID=1775544 RepID=UPI0010846072|nr:hypothetical protein [Halorhabdus rudnickae]
MPSTKQPYRAALAVVLLVLVGLSGCAGVSDTGSPTQTAVEATSPTSSATQTPTATPTATPAGAELDRFPAGLTDSGVRNVTQLLRTHKTAAIETPGILTQTTNRTGVLTQTTNRTLRNFSVVTSTRVATDTNLTRIRYVTRGQRTIENQVQNSTTALAANETTVRQYTVRDGNSTLDNRRNRTTLFNRSFRTLSTATSPLGGVLRHGNFSLIRVDDSETNNTVTLRADQYESGKLFEARNVVAYNATVQMTTEGLIKSATERIVAKRNGTENRYRFTYEFEPQSVDLPAVPQIPADVRIESGASKKN